MTAPALDYVRRVLGQTAPGQASSNEDALAYVRRVLEPQTPPAPVQPADKLGLFNLPQAPETPPGQADVARAVFEPGTIPRTTTPAAQAVRQTLAQTGIPTPPSALQRLKERVTGIPAQSGSRGTHLSPTPGLARQVSGQLRPSERLAEGLDRLPLAPEAGFVAELAPAVENVARGVIPGAVENLTVPLRGVANAVELAQNPLQAPAKVAFGTQNPVSEALSGLEQRTEQAFQPEGVAGTVGRVAGGFIGDPILAYAALSKAARVLRATGQAARAARFDAALAELEALPDVPVSRETVRAPGAGAVEPFTPAELAYLERVKSTDVPDGFFKPGELERLTAQAKRGESLQRTVPEEAIRSPERPRPGATRTGEPVDLSQPAPPGKIAQVETPGGEPRILGDERGALGKPGSGDNPPFRPSIDHGILSPSGRVSKRAEAAAKERIRVELFGPEGLQRPGLPPPPPEAEVLLRQAKELRDLAARGMKPRAYAKRAAELESRAAELLGNTEAGRGALPIMGGLAGGVAGGTLGYQTAEEDASPAEKFVRTALGAVGGAAVGAGLGAGAERLGRKGAAPMVEIDAAAKEQARMDEVLNQLLTPEERLGPSKMGQGVRRRRTAGPVEPYPASLEDYQVQVNRFLADPSGTKSVAERVAELKASGAIAPKERVSFAAMRQSADALDLDRIINQPKNRALTGPEGIAIRDEYHAVEAVKTEALRRQANLPEQSVEYQELERGIRIMESRQDALMTRFIPGASQQGRDFVALKAQSLDNLDPFAWERRILQAKGEGGLLTAEERASLRDAIHRGDRRTLIQMVQDAERPLQFWSKDWLTWLAHFRKSSLLTPGSMFKAFIGNPARAVHTELTKGAQILADQALSAALGTPRTLSYAPGGWKAYLKGLWRGFREVPQVMRGGISEIEAMKNEIPRRVNLSPIFGKRAWGNAWMHFNFRMQALADRPFSYAARDKAFVEMAWRLAKRDKALFAELLKNPTDDMITLANMEGLYATYQNPTALGNIAQGAKRAARQGVKIGNVRVGGGIAGVGLDLVAPFTGTPSAVVTQGIEATPLGLAATPVDLARLYRAVEGKNPREILTLQRIASRRVGQASTGLVAMVLGAQWAKEKITGDWPESQSERDTWRREGKTPWSLRMGERYYPLGVLGPLGGVLAFAKVYSEEPTFWEGVAGGTAAVPKMALEQSYLQGVKEVLDVAQGDKKPARMAGSIGASFVPSIVGQAARTIDPVYRRPEDFADAILVRIPGASKKVPASTDLFGRPAEREPKGALFRAVRAFFDPFGSSPDRTLRDPIVAEMQRVGAAVSDRRRAVGRPTDADVRALVQQEGPRLRAALEYLIQSSEYQGYDDPGKAAAIERVVTLIRTDATKAFKAARARAGAGAE